MNSLREIIPKSCGKFCDTECDDVLGGLVGCVCCVMIPSTCGGNSRLFGTYRLFVEDCDVFQDVDRI